jgi:VanZ family protein
MANDTGNSGPGPAQVDLTLVLGKAMFRRTAQFTFAIGVLAVITLSLIPKEALPETGIWDKLHHVLAYGGLAASGGLGFVGWRRMVAVGIGLVMLGGLLEVAQAAIPGRFASVDDAFANAIGVMVGLVTALAGNLFLIHNERSSS